MYGQIELKKLEIFISLLYKSKRTLKHRKLDSKKYQIIFDNGKKTKESLWGVRDQIVHANYTLTKHEYEVFKEASKWAFKQLFTNMPMTYDLARKQYLEHKRKYDNRAG